MLEKIFKPFEETKFISDKAIKILARLNIYNIRDLIFHLPASIKYKKLFPNFNEIENGELVTIIFKIDNLNFSNYQKSPIKLKIEGHIDNINIEVLYFRAPPKFFYSKLKEGQNYIISGKVEKKYNSLHFIHPEFYFNRNNVSEKENIYPLTYGLINRSLENYILKALAELPEIKEWISPTLKLDRDWPSFKQAITLLHKPDMQRDDKFRERLAFDELFAYQLALALARFRARQVEGNSVVINQPIKQQILESLGFTLTYGQQQVIEEIESDIRAPHKMMRMLQGDVGAGKTLVALLTMVSYVAAGKQVALMAPTDILATQHYSFFEKALNSTDYKVALLTGKLTTAQKNKLYKKLENGEIDIVIGTHALFQKKVNFKNLAYAVIDEQHRFGVLQRIELSNKGDNVDLLIMTATPIPRSLNLTLFGDLDISQLTEKPQGRLPIQTFVKPISELEKVYKSIESLIAAGQKTYWICPLVEPKDEEEGEPQYEMANAVDKQKILSEIFPNQVGLVHGKLKAQDKEQQMADFKDGENNILVATTVIEVGVDVKDASLIVIENAENFGLAQLHQLRGRVGRGNQQSYCILLYGKRTSKIARERLEVMRSTNDGFIIAEEDLKLRGGGEMIGTKQSGEQEFSFANLTEDYEILKLARLEANRAVKFKEQLDKEILNDLLKLFKHQTYQQILLG